MARKNPGRPPTMRNGQQISFWCSEALVKALGRKARRLGMTRSALIRSLCSASVKAVP